MNLKLNPAMLDIGHLTRTGPLGEFQLPLIDPLGIRRNEVPIPEGAQFITASHRNRAGTRDYKLFVPSTYHGQPSPLIVMLHGGTQDPNDFAVGTRMNELAEKDGLLVAYPAQPTSANFSKCWNWFQPGNQKRDHGEPSIIAGITGDVCEKHAVDQRRIYIAGMSAGGAMAMTMAMSYPELYAAVGIHSGIPHAAARDLPSAMGIMHKGPTDSPPAPRSIRAIVFHGDRDTTVHPNNGAKVLDQCLPGQRDARATIETVKVPNGNAYTRSIYLDANGRPVAEHWLVHDAGHAWSGGSSRGSFTNSKGPDASKEMLRFFLQNPQR